MAQLNQQKLTDFEKKLVKKISLLNKKIKKLPAFSRRKKDEENWQDFFTFFLFIALAGIVIIGAGGWLAVALSGTLLSLIIVESGLFLSIVVGFCAWPLFNVYLWTRDLFCSDRIKSQNKQYDQFHENLLELKELAAEKKYLSAKIAIKLNNTIECFPFEFFAQGNINFAQLSLKDQINLLEQEKKNLEIKVENKQYAQLEKVIADLKNLDEQVSHLDQMINRKLRISTDVITQTYEQGNTQKLSEFSENKKQEYVYKIFQESTISSEHNDACEAAATIHLINLV